jgi:hypothetical protein
VGFILAHDFHSFRSIVTGLKLGHGEGVYHGRVHMASKAAYLMVARKQNKREAQGTRYILKGIPSVTN